MTTVTINGHEVPLIENIGDLKQYYNPEFLRDFRSLKRLMVYISTSMDPYGEYRRPKNREQEDERVFGPLRGCIRGEIELGAWHIDLYRLDEIDYSIFVDHYPVLVDYEDVRYVLDVQY
jgi:hypothetical protein